MSANRHRLASWIASMVLGTALTLAGEVALAMAQRTFVASTGSDANNCSLVLPCRSFAAALAQTLDGGEIIVVDSAGYATLTINQSVSIIAPPGVYAGITAITSANGVTITGNSLVVVLRGLTINATDPSMLQGNGILVASNNSRLLVQRASVSGFAFGASLGDGVVANQVSVEDSTIIGCGMGIGAFGDNFVMLDRIHVVGGGGVQIHTARTHVRDSVFEKSSISVQGNNSAGALNFTVEGSTLSPGGITIILTGSPVSGGIQATVARTVVSGSLQDGIVIGCDEGASGTVTITDSVISNNGLSSATAGIRTTAGNCAVAVSHSVISGNAGTSIVNAGGGTFVSFGDNRIYGNNPDAPSGTVTLVPTR